MITTRLSKPLNLLAVVNKTEELLFSCVIGMPAILFVLARIESFSVFKERITISE